MIWTMFDTWIVLAGALPAMACALLGCFLVLRRMSMMGDAISHTVLPGIAVGFLLTGARTDWPMFLGACLAGVVTVVLIQFVRRLGQVEEGAAMGVIFTALFAVGLILIRWVADRHRVDLDPDCVLYGQVELTPLYTVSLWGFEVPKAVVMGAIFLAINISFVGMFYKELKIVSFDPDFATTQGFSSQALHYIVMVLIAATVVAAFEAVGSILVIAMLVIPGAAAYLLTDRLPVMLVLSMLIAGFGAFLGHAASIAIPHLLGVPETYSAGLMGVAVLGFFVVAMAFSPRYGVLARLIARLRLSLKITRDDVLGLLYRHDELDPGDALRMTPHRIREALDRGWLTDLALRRLQAAGMVVRHGDQFELTVPGREQAREVVRSHRLWESYLVERLGLKADHVHEAAERLEHITDRTMRERLAEVVQDPRHDPHARDIPPE